MKIYIKRPVGLAIRLLTSYCCYTKKFVLHWQCTPYAPQLPQQADTNNLRYNAGEAHKTGNVRLFVHMGVRSRKHCYRGKATSITYSECVSVTLVIQQEKCMRRSILSSVACLDVLYSPTLSHKRHKYRGGGKLLNIKYVFWFSLQLSVKHFSF